MSTQQISFEIPTRLLHTLNQNQDEFTAQVRLWAALQLFQAHKLTLGQAIELADLSREQFLFELDRRQIPLIDYDPAELENELTRL
ncbi:MAG: UPF0175 family protein [Anaerolineales bacterium]|nr:UPF0175 family protein [Anaerolineales bacterium]MCA9978235.1 UPF0175 family protein [Anaerolineales bacterium]